ncbi:hypothetical protein BKG82_26330 [Mycobacteroides chelonae]|uniref:Restriction endonuclease n=1 Tax=Mycobacteroides chelonae TaxID=1774 RepID=A0A1S1LHJ7_MYCCH|nr:hypothetical protein [Mycobacteroides chelonae]OHU47177.1 hypothetical protein BKG82_26330 [Mycobacteroides chelonae]
MSAVTIDPNVTVLVHQVVRALRDGVYVGAEKQVQKRIEKALAASELEFEREFRLDARDRPGRERSQDRPDFFVGGCVAIEVKLKTPRTQVLRQLGRYAEHGQVKAIVLASTSFTTLKDMQVVIHGVPVYPVVLRGGGLLG